MKRTPALLIALVFLLIIAAGLIAVQSNQRRQAKLFSGSESEQDPVSLPAHDNPAANSTQPLFTARVNLDEQIITIRPIGSETLATGLSIELTITPALTSQPASNGILQLSDSMKAQNWMVAVNKQETDLVENQTRLSFAALNMSGEDIILNDEMTLNMPISSNTNFDPDQKPYEVIQSQVELTRINQESAAYGAVVLEIANE